MATTTIVTGQVTLNSSSSLQIVAARPGREQLILRLTSGVRIGPSGVTTSTGAVPPVDPLGFATLETEAEVHGIAAVGTSRVEFIELFTPP